MQHQERLQFPQLQICKFETLLCHPREWQDLLHAQKVVPEGDRASRMQEWNACFQMPADVPLGVASLPEWT